MRSDERPPTGNRRLRRVIGLLVVLTVSALLVQGCASLIGRAIVTAPNAGRRVESLQNPDESELARLGVSRQLRIEVGPPAASLSIWIIDPSGVDGISSASVRSTVLVLHGIRDRKHTQVGLGQALAAQGYRAVLIDLRGHGDSTGQWMTYGVVESRDLKQVLDALDEQELLDGPVGVFGPSYGGAAALQLAAADARVKAIVTIATFTSLAEVVPCYLDRYWLGHVMSRGTVRKAIARAGEIAGFDPQSSNCLKAIAGTEAAVLLIHGKNDANVPCQHSERLHAAANDRCRLLLLDDEDHYSIHRDCDGVILRETLAWFEQHLKQ